MAAEYISVEGKFFLLTDGTVIPWEAMMDADGNDTEDPTQCVIAVFQIPEGYAGAGRWSGHDIREFADDQRISRTLA
jgi:hypothetical protein